MTDSQAAPAASAASPIRASSGAIAGVPPSTVNSMTWMPRCTAPSCGPGQADRRTLSAREVKLEVCRRTPPAAARRQTAKVSVGGEGRLDQCELAGQRLEAGPTRDGPLPGVEDEPQVSE